MTPSTKNDDGGVGVWFFLIAGGGAALVALSSSHIRRRLVREQGEGVRVFDGGDGAVEHPRAQFAHAFVGLLDLTGCNNRIHEAVRDGLRVSTVKLAAIQLVARSFRSRRQ